MRKKIVKKLSQNSCINTISLPLKKKNTISPKIYRLKNVERKRTNKVKSKEA